MAAKKKKKPAKSKPKNSKKKAKAPARKKRRPVARASAVAKRKPAIRRRDRAGHIDPKYAKQLRQKSGHTNKTESIRPAFALKDDDLAEELGEEVVGKATTGEDEGEDNANRDYVEEVGGPFVVTTGGEEYAEGTDASNPEDATVEPFPKT